TKEVPLLYPLPGQVGRQPSPRRGHHGPHHPDTPPSRVANRDRVGRINCCGRMPIVARASGTPRNCERRRLLHPIRGEGGLSETASSLPFAPHPAAKTSRPSCAFRWSMLSIRRLPPRRLHRLRSVHEHVTVFVVRESFLERRGSRTARRRFAALAQGRSR